MTNLPVTPAKPLVSLLAQLNEVYVFQTKAFDSDADMLTYKGKQMQQTGRTSYGELNLGLHVHDDPKRVLANRMGLLTAINKQIEAHLLLSPTARRTSAIGQLHWVNQVHGKQIHDIDAPIDAFINSHDDPMTQNVTHCPNATNKLSMRPLDADAIISQQVNVGLAIMTADCVPVVLYQPTTGQIAAIHAGWQGLACGVIKATAERFVNNDPIVAWIGVCISQTHYEVDHHVLDKLRMGCVSNALLDSATLDQFIVLFSRPSSVDIKGESEISLNADIDAYADNYINDADLHKSIDKLSNYATLSTDKVSASKVKLDLPKLAAYQLEYLGITVANETPIACSYDDASYYSYRRQTHLQQPATGRMALIIVRQG